VSLNVAQVSTCCTAELILRGAKSVWSPFFLLAGRLKSALQQNEFCATGEG
jgi:hypothetical protein